MKKMLAILIAPLLSLIVLFGCSAPKYTTADVKREFGNFMDSYITDTTNNVFKFNLIPQSSLNDEGIFNEENLHANFTLEKIMYITYGSALNAKVNSDLVEINTLNAQYNQLRTVYQTMLSLTYNYYANWSHNFFTNITQTEIEQEEINSLYSKIKDLKKATDEFLNARQALESFIQMNSIDSEIAIPRVSSLNLKFNVLIEKSLSFVNQFKDLHKKYIFNDTDITANSAKRLVDEVILQIAQAVYYDNVKAFEENNGVKLYELITKFSGNKYNIVTSTNWLQDLTYEHTTGRFIIANSNLEAKISEEFTVYHALTIEAIEEEVKAAAIARVTHLKMLSQSFEQHFKIYKAMFNKVSLTNYNIERELATKPNSYNPDKLSFEEKANIQAMKNFNSDSIVTLISALFNVMADQG